jgi:mono/diheme cytochrome c family protein
MLGRLRAPVVLLAVAVALVSSGCGAVAHMTDGEGQAPSGKKLFQTHCGSCHTMKDAGTKGTLGPNLDDVFGIVKAQEFDESTIRDLVRGQIAYPETETATGGPGMPANLVEGQDADDVAQYVAQCAGVPNCSASR